MTRLSGPSRATGRDEETQKNDLDIVRLVANVNKEVPIERAYDFSFAAQAIRS
jgi:hypothetical protein